MEPEDDEYELWEMWMEELDTLRYLTPDQQEQYIDSLCFETDT